MYVLIQKTASDIGEHIILAKVASDDKEIVEAAMLESIIEAVKEIDGDDVVTISADKDSESGGDYIMLTHIINGDAYVTSTYEIQQVEYIEKS